MEDRYQIIYTDRYDLDYDEIQDYYIAEYKNANLMDHLDSEVQRREKLLKMFPYSFTIFESNNMLRHEYRTFNVLNYKVFYYIDELAKIVYMQRLLYAGMNFNSVEL